jgi:hypothetical protein
MGERRNAYKSVSNPERKRPVERPVSRWEGSIKLYLKKEAVKTWTGFSWLRIRSSGGLFVDTVMNFRVP